MNDLFSAHWTSTGRRADLREIDRLRLPPSGFGRLLAAVAIIGVAVCVLDYVSADGTLIAHGSSERGSWK